MMQRSASFALFMIGLLVLGVAGWYIFRRSAQPVPVSPTATILPPSETPHPTPTPIPAVFDGQRAYEDVEAQVAMGPRIPGTEGHARFQEWAGEQLQAAGWQLEIQQSEALGNPVENLVARRGDSPPQVILGAHYDTRIFADSDPDPANHALPVPGANDGASGVAVLLELARVLPQNTVPIWLVFFDAEDNGRIEGWDWILGSREFVRNTSFQPRAAIIVDMVGDADLKLYKEANSDPALTDSIWAVAQVLGYGNIFLPDYIGGITDDHIPFVEAGIPAIDIIDFTYPYWHTVADTPDKVSAQSLQAVGETLQTWIMQQTPQP
jgi:Zn-dependent M28 family amino/carboxypeptidase